MNRIMRTGGSLKLPLWAIKISHATALAFWLLFILLGPLSPTKALNAADAAVTGPTEDGLADIWQDRIDDLTEVIRETGRIESNAKRISGPLLDKLQADRLRFTRLSSLFQASRGHPAEQLTLVQQMRVIRNSLARELAPLEDMAAALDAKSREISALREDLRNFVAEEARSSRAEALPGEGGAEGTNRTRSNAGRNAAIPASRTAQQSYIDKLAQTAAELTRVSAGINAVLAPAHASLERFTQTVESIEKDLVSVWESYYFSSSGTELSYLTSTRELMADWASSTESRLSFAYPQSNREWLGFCSSFLVSAAIFALLGLFLLRMSKRLAERWRDDARRLITRSWALTALGLAVLAASGNVNGGVYLGLVLLGSLLLIAGMASAAWRLRMAARSGLRKAPSPLNRLYPPAAVGVLMLFSDLPVRFLGWAWGAVMLVFLLVIFRHNRKRVSGKQLPLPERFAYGSAFVFGLGALLFAAAGYARLGILLFMLCFALVNILIMGCALAALLGALADRLYDKNKKPILNALANTLAVPAAWLLSLLCALPWVWAVPGTGYLLRHLFSTHYTFGQASLDFSRLILILMLFLLFRAFTKMGKRSMERLPEKMPHLERGVIPPLRSILTYVIWGLFLLLVLGLLGVNFTSLAVVAGGLSVGVGLGMQNLFSNLTSGMMLIFERALLVGDYVDVGGVSGTVRKISIRSTVLETPDKVLVYVPNSTFMSGQFSNWTRDSRVIRGTVIIGVTYQADTAQVEKILLASAEKQEHVLKTPPPSVYLSEFGDSAMNFTLYVYIDDLNNMLQALSELRMRVKSELDRLGIDIPYPQMTLHMTAPDEDIGESGENLLPRKED